MPFEAGKAPNQALQRTRTSRAAELRVTADYVFSPANDWRVVILATPEAARVVFDSGAPLAVGCGNVCLRDPSFTTEECRALLKDTGKAGAWLAKCFAEHAHGIDRNGRKVWPIWDNITPAHILGFTRTVEHHRPRIAEDLSFDHSNSQGQLTWVESVETEGLWADFVKKLKVWDEPKR